MREELFYWEEIFYMFWYIDPYYFMLIVPAMLIALLAQARVSSTFNRYSRVYSHRGITAAQVARNILDENGQAPLFDNMNLVMLTKDNAQGFINLMAEGGLLTEADFDTLLYRNNPNVDYQSFYDFVGNVDELISERIS